MQFESVKNWYLESLTLKNSLTWKELAEVGKFFSVWQLLYMKLNKSSGYIDVDDFILVTMFGYWWRNFDIGDIFRMLVTKTVETDTNISKLSPRHSVTNFDVPKSSMCSVRRRSLHVTKVTKMFMEKFWYRKDFLIPHTVLVILSRWLRFIDQH